jgi:transketolase
VSDKSVDQLCINTLRTLSIDMIQKANSGHPGLPLGAAPMAYVLWQNHLNFNPEKPDWTNRDRFVLSAGHGSSLLYSLLHLFGYNLTIDDIKSFRQWESRTPGHPEAPVTDGVEATTGPLGQGTANAVGMAIAERMLAARFNKPGHEIIDHFTYALVSDGDIMEGISSEAASFAGHLKLGKLIYVYDDNGICLDGPTSMTFSENVGQRYEAYGWQVITVKDGDTDIAAINKAIAEAKADTSRPSLICIKTTIGYGSPKQGECSCHGSPLGDEGILKTKDSLGWESHTPFDVPAEASANFGLAATKGKKSYDAWTASFEAYRKEFPELAEQLLEALAGKLPTDWDKELPSFNADEKPATRKAGGMLINAVAAKVPYLAGGDADLSSSTKTNLSGEGSFNGTDGSGRNIHFGIREHAMGSIANGIAYHGGIRPYASTFFCFSNYMLPPMRIAAMDSLPVIYVFTHDSIGVGEDGPTHQPVEHLLMLRVIPNLTVIRPSDGNEATEAWRYAMNNNGPTVLVLSRQGLPVLDRSVYAPASGLAQGAYVVSEADGGKPQAAIIASGSEVSVAIEAQKKLADKSIKVRVVSMPCWEAFEAQDQAYKDSVLPPELKARVTIEAGVTIGWHKYAGDAGISIGVDRFGSSSPGGLNMEKYGITADNVVSSVEKLI